MKSLKQYKQFRGRRLAWETRKDGWRCFIKAVYREKIITGNLQEAWDSTKLTYNYSEREARMAENYYHKHPEIQ